MSIYQPYARLTPEERRARQTARSTAITARRKQLMESRETACEACGWLTPVSEPGRLGAFAGLSQHHIILVSQGGTDEPDNLIQLCACCHAIVHAMQLDGGFEREKLAQQVRDVLDRRHTHAPNRLKRSPVMRARALAAALAKVWETCRRGRNNPELEALRKDVEETLNEWGWS
jgi:hypothetical protein